MMAYIFDPYMRVQATIRRTTDIVVWVGCILVWHYVSRGIRETFC